MAKGEIAALKEALCNQHLIIKKLYVELEEEREASSTATTEALSMILRLQREKAAEKMEASQYKRMAEERINHAEESLDILEEAIQQKDLEIESLLFQLKANNQKQTNLGSNISDFGDMMLCENKSCCNNGILRRNVSLPLIRRDEFCYDKRFTDENSENEVDDVFKEVSNVKNSAVCSYSSVTSNEIESTSSPIGPLVSWFSSPSSDASSNSTKRSKDIEAISISTSQYEQIENASSLTKQYSGQVKYSALFHDIFEVPESHKGCKSGELCKKLFQDTNLETNSMIEIPNMDLGDGNSSSCCDIEELGIRIQKLEEDSERGKEQLKEVLMQMNTFGTNIKMPKSSKSSHVDESSFVSIMEAVLSFSI